MHYSYFKLDTTTFSSVPILKYVVNTTSFQTVRENLNNGFHLGKTIAIVTGETGTGKTLLCHCLISNLSAVRLVTIKANPRHNTIDILTEICDQLEVDYPDKYFDKDLILDLLRDFFISTKGKSDRIVIIIDEAQYIKEELFRHLTFLFCSDVAGRAKHHIILTGTPELIDAIYTFDFVSEIEKNVVRSELVAMSEQDSISYIRRRVAVGGATNRIFTSSAELAIFQQTSGIPRLINILCDHCLRIAYKRSESIVTTKIVKHTIKKTFPPLLSMKEGVLKQKFTQFKDVPSVIFNGTNNKIKKVLRPLQEKFSRKNRYDKEEKNLLKLLDSTENKINKKGIDEQKTNESSGLSSDSETDKLISQNLPRKKTDVINLPQLSIPKDMVVISGGSLQSAYSNAVEDIVVASFLLDLMPVTNRQYNDFIEETNYLPPEHWWDKNFSKELLDHPVVGVSYEDTLQFSEWIGKRLPTAEEWERAARSPDNRKFPWGNNEDLSYYNSIESGLNETSPVDAFPKGASANGCLDLVGNVWEWIDAETKKNDLEEGYAFVFGGSFRHECVVNEAIARTVLLQMNRYAYVGFRCAKDL